MSVQKEHHPPKTMIIKATLGIAFILLTSLTTLAQLKLGPQVDVYNSKIDKQRILVNDEMMIDGSNSFGTTGDLRFRYGLFVRYDLSKVYVKVAPSIATYHSSFRLQSGAVESYFNNQVIKAGTLAASINTIEVPVTAGFKIGIVNIHGGLVPVFTTKAKTNYNLVVSQSDGNSKIESGSMNDTKYYQKSRLDAQIGIGVNFLKRFYADINYQNNLTQIRQDINGANGSGRLSSIGLSVSMNLLK